MKYTFYLLAFIFLATSCKKEGSDQVDGQLAAFDQLTEQTMEVHDEVMDKMGELMELSSQVDERSQMEMVSDEDREQLLDIKSQLNDAHSAMMDWMKDYSDAFPFEAEEPTTQLELEEKMPVLQDYHDKMKAVKNQTDEAIANAELALSTSE